MSGTEDQSRGADHPPTPAERERLMDMVRRVFGRDEQARAQAATDLIDLGELGARSLARVMMDGEVNAHPEGLWALLHAWADFMSLEIPPALQDELVEAALFLLGSRVDNQSGVAWMAADVLAQHALEGRGLRVRERVEDGFRQGLAAPARAVILASAYGLARLRSTQAPMLLAEKVESSTDMVLVDYLRRTLARLEEDEDPEILPEGC